MAGDRKLLFRIVFLNSCLLGTPSSIRIYDLRSRELLAEFHGHKSIVTAAVFSSDDALVVSASFDHTLRVWDSSVARSEGFRGGPAFMLRIASGLRPHLQDSVREVFPFLWFEARGQQGEAGA